MGKQPKQNEPKSQFGLTLPNWDIRLIKAIAWKISRGQQEVLRQALLPGLIDLAGGSVQSADALIQEWESSTQNADSEPDETKPDGTEPKH